MAEQTLAEWLGEEPFGLTLSSGFFGFFAHTGMTQALYARGLVPARMSGSSAGALVSGALASGLTPSELGERLATLKRKDFWDPRPGLGVLRGKKFRTELSTMLAENIEDTEIPLAISVFDILSRDTRVIRTGSLPQAVHASCAVPGMFHPVRIGARLYLDGGIRDRPGLVGMPRDTRVLFHHLASKSPWRFALKTPHEAGMCTLWFDGLERSGPYKLDAGVRAMDQAREAAERALNLPVSAMMGVPA